MQPMLKITALILCLLLFSIASGTEKQKDFSIAPTLKNGEKWNIGYYQGGDFENYYEYLKSSVQGLMTLGWIEDTPIPEFKNQSTHLFWKWLSTKAESRYIRFLDDAYYTADWDKESRKVTSEKLIKRLSGSKDIDLIIAMGTWAGKDLANNKHQVNTLVMSTSNPIMSRIIKSNEDSGYDHVHARVDPLRYERQVRIFYAMVKFKKLGVAYEDTSAGRSYAAIDLIEKVAKEKNFEVVRCLTKSDIADKELANKSVTGCFEKLFQSVDAIYVTVQGGVNSKTLPKLVKMALDKKVPTFSQMGSKEVRKGILLSISRKGGYKAIGNYFATVFARIFNGAKPRELSQVFEEDQNFAINLKTAELIGFYLHADIIAAADEIYHEIEAPLPDP
ncbi:MAG: ABC transporter substrate-binding protein [Desulfobacteraceae bacterium]|nr:ABC transporter substrate-binding protein [Desulfobacteraceae bacterium]